jgi:hypothetical protein
LLTCTAAAVTLLVVKTAAARAPSGHTISPKSALPDFLTPQATPAAKKPFDPVTVLFAILAKPFRSSLRLCTPLLGNGSPSFVGFHRVTEDNKQNKQKYQNYENLPFVLSKHFGQRT